MLWWHFSRENGFEDSYHEYLLVKHPIPRKRKRPEQKLA
jgi:hypothetical protein